MNFTESCLSSVLILASLFLPVGEVKAEPSSSWQTQQQEELCFHYHQNESQFKSQSWTPRYTVDNGQVYSTNIVNNDTCDFVHVGPMNVVWEEYYWKSEIKIEGDELVRYNTAHSNGKLSRIVLGIRSD